MFGDSKRGSLAFYPEENTTPTRDTRDTPRITPQGEGTNAKNNVMFTDFTLANQWFTAMDGAGAHDFKFTEALSFIVNCDTQEEIDHFWSKLSHVPEAEQCGWCKDEYGVSWQIVPRIMNDMMSKGTPEQSVRVTKAFLQMKKFDIKKLEAAYNA